VATRLPASAAPDACGPEKGCHGRGFRSRQSAALLTEAVRGYFCGMIKNLALALLFSAALATPALADVTAGSLVVSEPWTRATPPGARVGGGYLTITNSGSEPDTLVSVASGVSEKTELHMMKTEDGVMTMRPAEGGVEIPAGGTLRLEPGGYHIMFIRPKAPFQQGESVPLTLTFEKAGAVTVDLVVSPIGAPGPAKSDGDKPAMDHSSHGQHGSSE
jgi:copper(I)-binding protein